ncbi:Outer membrane receptor for ferrienterochelin and colicins [Marivirga sericea]|uniref:Outer membrane receptor for ferrienterochelin and colicins n=1 Tax=Marivirga sericea TaxID=1028 RepID=A0A1X7KCG3_9BACT|nr:TonB-dependent receptor [Marivirga sericea]SMG38602.1 Outer membrane receptor for ferrienterochelin and colicins [Marivirga sericea]
MKYLNLLVPLFLLLFTINSIQAQGLKDVKISISQKNIPAVDLLNKLENQYEIEFRYKYEWLEDIVLNVEAQQEPIEDFFKEYFGSKGLSLMFKEPNYFILLKDSPKQIEISAESSEDRSEVITLGNIDSDAEEATLYGTVKSAETGEILPGITIISLEENKGTVSSTNGKYSLVLPVGFHTVKFQSLETGNFEISIVLNSSSNLDVKLYKDFVQLNEVVVTAKAFDENISETVTGVERMTLEEIEKMPAFLGEADVIKSITSLPGVSLTGEASAGFNVRGSGVGANLVLLDNGTLYNSSHLFGVFSAFSADNIGSIEIYKGAVPARFGGRISSVLNMEMRSGSKQKVKGNGGIGVISSRFNIETPIIKDKSSILTGFRVAYPNYLINAVDNFDLKRSSTFFGDWSLKYDHSINESNKILVTAYTSRDEFTVSNDVSYEYNNLVGSVQWNQNLNENLSSKLNYNYSQYNYTLNEEVDEQQSFGLYSVIENNKLNYEFEFTGFEKNLIEFGFNNVLYNLQPGKFNQNNNSLLVVSDLTNESAIESAIYLSDEVEFTDNISAYGGLRYSYYSGGRDSLSANFGGFEPRLSLNYRIDSKSSIKAGYSKMRQYIHLISNTASVTPVDIWKLSNQEIAPTVSDQYTIGYFRNFDYNNFEASAEFYYRDIENLIDYKNGANLFANDEIEEELVQGKGVAYGAEFYLKKNRGRLTGWVSYTYSRSLIIIDGESSSETINNGNPFPTNFDQPHNITFLGNFELSKRFDISANFQYNTGRPITYPESTFDFNGIRIANYSERNQYRIPDYHRLDLSFHMASSLKKKKNIEADWTLTLYNVYSRRNAYSVFFRSSESLRVLNSYRLAIIGQIVPALTYNFKF